FIFADDALAVLLVLLILPFALGAILIGPTLLEYRRLKNVVYAITNRRVLQVRESNSGPPEALTLSNYMIRSITLVNPGSDRGDILIARYTQYDQTAATNLPGGMFGIPRPSDVRAVLVRQPYTAHIYPRLR